MSTLDELEERIEALEEAQADQLVPAVFTINENGEIEEKISGEIEAKGITFNEGVSTDTGKAKAESQIIWNDAGEQPETIRGVRTHHAIAPFGFDHALSMTSQVGNLLAQLELDVYKPAGSAKLLASAGEEGALHQLTILDALGKSSFVQLPTVAAAYLNLGGALITFTKGKAASTVVVVNHGLPSRPFSITFGFENVGSQVTVHYGGVGETTFEAQAYGNGLLEGSFFFSWLAMT